MIAAALVPLAIKESTENNLLPVHDVPRNLGSDFADRAPGLRKQASA